MRTIDLLLLAFSVFFALNSSAQCTGSGAIIVPNENWLLPTYPPIQPAPPWGGNNPPTSSGPVISAACTSAGYRQNCILCPATWEVEVAPTNRAFIYLCKGNTYLFSTCGSTELWDSQITITSSVNVVMAFDDDGCGDGDGHASIQFSPQVSQVYFIRVDNSTCNSDTSQHALLRIQCMAAACPPAGDNPCASDPAPSCNPNFEQCASISGAIPLQVNGTICTPTQATTIEATATTNINPPVCGGYPNNGDVWFNVVIPTSGNVLFEIEHISASNLAMEWYTADDCTGPFFPEGCNADPVPGVVTAPRIIVGRPDLAGQEVFIRVWPQNNVANGGSFTICAREFDPPANDSPCDAAMLPVNETCAPQQFTLMDATLSSGVVFSPATPTCGSPILLGDVWMQAIAPASGRITIQLNAVDTMNLGMAAYTLGSDPCAIGPFLQINCTTVYFADTVVMNVPDVTAGTTVFLRVWNRTSNLGAFSICTIPTPAPANDDPCGAFALNLVHGCLPINVGMYGATPSALPPSVSCSNWTTDVWYTVTVPDNGAFVLNTDDGSINDAAFEFYSAVSGSCANDDLVLEAIPNTCRTNGSTNAGAVFMPSDTIVGLDPGSQVWIRIMNETVISGNLALCAGYTDTLPIVPLSSCFITLNMYDSAGDGWGGSYVTINVGAVPTNYTLPIGGSGSVSIPIIPIQPYTIVYTAIGGHQNEISYTVNNYYGAVLYSSPSIPTPGFNSAGTMGCNESPPSDCNSSLFRQYPNNFSASSSLNDNGWVEDLIETNRGCLIANEQLGTWYRIAVTIDGPLFFQLTPTGTGGQDLDFALWGPLAPVVCPPASEPIRCSYAATLDPTGLNMTALDLSEGATGDGWVKFVGAMAGENYLLYVTTHDSTPSTFTLTNDLTIGLAEGITDGMQPLLIFPNPTNGTATLRCTLPNAGKYSVLVIDAAGRTISTIPWNGTDGQQDFQIATETFEAGAYLIEVRDANGSLVGRSRLMKSER